MFCFKDLVDEVKRRGTRDQGGTTFDTSVKNAINLALFRISREAPWRVMRRQSHFDTVASYTTGGSQCTGTSASVNITATGATLLADDVRIDRIVKFSGSSEYYTIRSITGETTLTIDRNFNASTTTNMTYEIYPQATYNLPIQAGHRMFLWHEDYGYPFKMGYSTEQNFYGTGYHRWTKNVPIRYRMWGEDMARQQPKQAGVLTVFSTESGDTSIGITIFGTSGGYPAYETITTNASDGTTVVTGGVLFSEVERVVKNATSAGRIGVYADAGTATTVAVMPMGDTTAGILYRKVEIHPLPTRIFPINVYYYKDPYRLVGDNDVHEMGQDFDETIILLATAKIKAQSSQKEATNFYALFLDELKTLRRTNADKIDWFPTLKRPRGVSGDPRVTSNLLFRQVGSQYGKSSRF